MYPTKAELERNPSLAAPADFYDADEDGWKADARAELKALESLNEEIDQLASDARDCDGLCPEAKKLLDLGWWFSEEAIRENTGHCSSGCDGKKYCECCRHFNELKSRAERIRRAL